MCKFWSPLEPILAIYLLTVTKEDLSVEVWLYMVLLPCKYQDNILLAVTSALTWFWLVCWYTCTFTVFVEESPGPLDLIVWNGLTEYIIICNKYSFQWKGLTKATKTVFSPTEKLFQQIENKANHPYSTITILRRDFLKLIVHCIFKIYLSE